VLDISEFRKAEGSLPCLSILFNEPGEGQGQRIKPEEMIDAR
jgi:hypothetical protein